jgi:hypothetical protein
MSLAQFYANDNHSHLWRIKMFCPECGEVITPGRFDGRDGPSPPCLSVLGRYADFLLRRKNKAAQNRTEG